MEELDIDIDDIRWYLSVQLAEELLKLQSTPRRLIEDIWSGKLGDQLFQMEERYIEELESDFDQNKIDEAKMREFLSYVRKAKRNRWIPQNVRNEDD